MIISPLPKKGLNHSYIFLLLTILSPSVLISQSPVDQKDAYEILIHPAKGAITIDGDLNESPWSESAQVEDFWQNKPVDGIKGSHKTVAYITYDENHIYVAAICYDDPSKQFVRTLKRDDWELSDEFAVVLDPIGKKAIGYLFGTNVLGGETEGLITAPNFADFTWDNRWTSAVKSYDDRWTVEMAIPFKTLRFKAGEARWGVQFLRIDPDMNELQAWAPVPRQFPMHDLGYFGSLIWDTTPAKQGNNVALIPYAKTSVIRDHSPGATTDVKADFGGDAKIALSTSLNLDLTANPDFSQVEVDEQVTNLTRFGIFFPERRQFFIENNDVFSNIGTLTEQPFYSRRIGLDATGEAVPILYGVRLSGNLNERLRIGAFNIHSQDSDTKAGQNYSAVTFQQNVAGRTFFNGLFLNRQGFVGSDATSQDFGRNLGGELEHITDNGKWQFTGGGITSMKTGFNTKNNHLYGSAFYSGQSFRSNLEVQHMGENFFTDMGFTGRLEQYDPINDQVVRVGFSQISNLTDYFLYTPQSKRLDYHWSGLENYVYLNTDGSLNEWYTRLRHFLVFKNTSILRFRLNNNYVDLLYPFSITEVPLPAKAYNMTEFNVQYNTDTRKDVWVMLFAVYGEFFNGTKLTTQTQVNFRQQPWGSFTVGLEQNYIYLPEPYGYLDLILANARMEINFSKRLFWTTFLQYNTQANNFNLNSRVQWRFAPMSDLYLVYTDNYRVEPAFGPKDKTLVLKLNYWLSL